MRVGRRPDPYEAIDARLRDVAARMLECRDLDEMRRLEAERDNLLDRRIALGRERVVQ